MELRIDFLLVKLLFKELTRDRFLLTKLPFLLVVGDSRKSSTFRSFDVFLDSLFFREESC